MPVLEDNLNSDIAETLSKMHLDCRLRNSIPFESLDKNKNFAENYNDFERVSQSKSAALFWHQEKG